MTRHAVPSPHASATVAPSAVALFSSRFALPLLFGAMLLAVASVAQAVTDTFTASGTWTAPAGVTSVDVEVWGGGGGGANWLTSNTDDATSFNSALSTAGGSVVVSNLVGMGGTVVINAPSTDTMTDGVRAITLNAPGVRAVSIST